MSRFLLLLTLFFLSPSFATAHQPEPTPAAPPAPPIPPTPAKVTLLAPGDEPREALRATPAADLSQTTRMRMLMASATSMNGADLPSPSMPAMAMTMQFNVKSISPEGDITYLMKITKCDIEATNETPPELAESLRAALAPVTQLSGLCTVTSRGITREATFDFPKDNPSLAMAVGGMRDQINQISAPFPEEAVGIGAKWRVDLSITNQGMKIDQTMTYTLKDRRDGAVFLDVAVEQAAADQKIDAPGLPEGTTLRLVSLKSSGGGTIELPLNMIVPRVSAMKLKTDLKINVGEGNDATSMNQSIKLDVSLAEVPKDAPQDAPKEEAAEAPAPSAPAK